MKQYTTIQSLIGQPVAVHCQTEAEANEFLKMIFSTGEMNPPKMKSIERAWREYGEVVCIELQEGYEGAAYSPVAYYKEQGFTIIPFSEFTNKAKPYTPEQLEYMDRCAIAAMQAEMQSYPNGINEKYADEIARTSYLISVAMLKAKQQLLTNK